MTGYAVRHSIRAEDILNFKEEIESLHKKICKIM